jgi:hypothetical protein
MPSLVHYIDPIGLNLVGRGNDGRVYLKGWDEFDRHSIVLRLADKPGMDFAGFKVAADRDLNIFGSRIRDAKISVEEIAEGDSPGTGRRLRSFVGRPAGRIGDISDPHVHLLLDPTPLHPRGGGASARGVIDASPMKAVVFRSPIDLI